MSNSTKSTIDWETLAKSSKPRRTMGKLKMAPPQRPSLSFDTPCDVTNRREHSNDRNLKLVPFALHEVDDEQDLSRVRYNSSSHDHDLSNPMRHRDRSSSPVPPNLKTFNITSNNSMPGLRHPRSASCFETPQNSKPVLQHASNGFQSAFRVNSNTVENDHIATEGSRSRHPSHTHSSTNLHRSRSMSSPSLNKPKIEIQSHQSSLSPLREQVIPEASNWRLPPTTSLLRPNKTNVQKGTLDINGNLYTIVDKIGSGGSSEVFRVLDENNTLRAVKQVDLSEVSKDEAMGFRNEVKLLMRLKDKKRIVQIFDFSELKRSDGRQILYVIMEHGEKDLAHLLREYAPGNGSTNNGLTDAKTKFYWEEMLEAVQVAHQEGIVHLDLKPANFLIVSGMIKLIDFGIASKVERDKTHVTKDNQLGTLNFMSPESIQDQSTGGVEGSDGQKIVKISYKSDVWSLGCILYNMVYGKLPFSHIRNPYQKICAILNQSVGIEFPSKGLENHDPLVLDVLKKCLVRDPTKRASIEELLQHPYLRKTTNQVESGSFLSIANESAGGPSQKMSEVLAAFSSLTPNSKKMLVKHLDLGS